MILAHFPVHNFASLTKIEDTVLRLIVPWNAKVHTLHSFIDTHTHTCIHTYIHTYIHIYIHILTYTGRNDVKTLHLYITVGKIAPG